MKKTPFFPAEDPETAASILDSCILLCDVFVAGKDSAVGIRYDEENMFAPMIMMLEKDASADVLVRAAENLGVPVVKNIMLAKNLCSYGKSGGAIPEASYRDVSLALARTGSMKIRRPRAAVKKPHDVPIRIKRPLSVELGSAVFNLTGEEPGREKLLAEPLDIIRKRLRKLLGLSMPLFHVSRSPGLRKDEYRILFKGLEAGRGRLELGWYAGEISGIPQVSFPDMMNNPENLKLAAKAAASVVVRHVEEIVQRRVPELLGRDEVEAILDAAEERYPVVTGEVKSLLPLGIVREILQSLVSEQVSIRHIEIILETLADWGSFGPAPSEVVIEHIRQSLKRQICMEYTDDRLTLRVLTLAPKLEKVFESETPEAGADTANSQGDSWESAISFAVRGMEEKGFPPVILCSPGVRSRIKESTRRKFPALAVLSYTEIPPDISVEPIGEILPKGNSRYPSLSND